MLPPKLRCQLDYEVPILTNNQTGIGPTYINDKILKLFQKFPWQTRQHRIYIVVKELNRFAFIALGI